MTVKQIHKGEGDNVKGDKNISYNTININNYYTDDKGEKKPIEEHTLIAKLDIDIKALEDKLKIETMLIKNYIYQKS